MIEIELRSIANQQFGVEIGEDRYLIRIRTFNDMTLMDISVNDVDILDGGRCIPNQAIIPYRQKTRGGNFLFVCPNKHYPHYTRFGVSQTFAWLTDDELESLANDE